MGIWLFRPIKKELNVGKEAINSIISLLPEKVIYDAACRYAIKLVHAGELEKAENLYNRLRHIDASFESLAEAATSLIGRRLARNELKHALAIYEHFPDCENSCGVLGEKLKACHSLVFALSPDHFKKAHELWQECRIYILNPCLKWQWVETGLALLNCCYRNSMKNEAGEIYQLIKKYGSCKTTRAFMDKAERIMAKINR